MSVTIHSAEQVPTSNAVTLTTTAPSILGAAARHLSRLAAACSQALLEYRTRLMLDDLDEYLQRDIGYTSQRRIGGSVRPQC